MFGFYADKGYISLQGFFIRNGKLLERTLAIQELYEDEMDAFISFIVQYYQDNMVPSEILVPQGVPVDLLEDLLQTHVRIPIRGNKKALVDLSLIHIFTD